MREEARAINNPNSQNNTGASTFNQTSMAAKKSPGYSSLERTMNIPKLSFGASPMVMSPLAQSGAAQMMNKTTVYVKLNFSDIPYL
jgi:hypothetical protein